MCTPYGGSVTGCSSAGVSCWPGLDNGVGYAFNDEGTALVQKLPYNPLKDERLYKEALASGDGIQFSHGIEEQIGGQLQAGFRLEDVYQDTDGQGNLHDMASPPSGRPVPRQTLRKAMRCPVCTAGVSAYPASLL